MILLQYCLTFCLSIAWPEVGLLILAFALASVGKVWGYTPIAGLGSLQLSDFAILGLTLNLLFNKRVWHNRKYVTWCLFVLWIVAIALIYIVTRADGLKLSYSMIVRYGLLWLIPIQVAELTPKKRHVLLVGMLICGAFVTAIQAYTYVKQDPAFSAKMYYQFQNERFYRTETDIQNEFISFGGFPRLYPSGALLVQALFIFVAVRFLLSEGTAWSRMLWAALFISYGLFFLSLRQRSSLLSLGIVLIMLVSRTFPRQRRFRIGLRAASCVVAGTLAVLGYQAATGAKFVEDFMQRFQNQEMIDNHRLTDNWLAVTALLGSPIIGIAHTDVSDIARAKGGASWGLDVHSLLGVGLLGGIPLLSLVILAAWKCARPVGMILFQKINNDTAVASALAVVYMFLVALLNFARPFTFGRDMVPMLLFVGFVESYRLSALQPARVVRAVRTPSRPDISQWPAKVDAVISHALEAVPSSTEYVGGRPVDLSAGHMSPFSLQRHIKGPH